MQIVENVDQRFSQVLSIIILDSAWIVQEHRQRDKSDNKLKYVPHEATEFGKIYAFSSVLYLLVPG